MRWERLFTDLEAELDGVGRRDLDDEVVVRTRMVRGEIRLMDRLRASRGRAVEVRVAGAGVAGGVIADVGPNWILLADDAGGELLIPRFAVLSAAGLSTRAAGAGPQAKLHAAMDFRYALNVIAQDRSHVGLTLVDGSMIAGVIDQVGADFLDIAHRIPGEEGIARRRSSVTVALGKVSWVRRA